ncbi:hypothetical protein GGI20_003190 [Coemansia sp. BCRC 34301]|nr:hypothetical protein GGI20_003190 [Coemansia sp. BCRC 34301]
MGNGNKAQMKRERNAKTGTEAKSQLKINVALTLHADNKHSKTFAECFPDYVENDSKAGDKNNSSKTNSKK